MKPRLVQTPPSTAASLAASQAFLSNRATNANLSNAAAAAALRSQTTSPMPVRQVQTKRMQRRASQSSIGNAVDRPGGLQRRDSGGSMTERSFRDPPPNRPASSHGPYAPYDEPPPVPALPKAYNISPPVSQKAARRAASVEPPHRIASPSPRLPGGRGISHDRISGQYRVDQEAAKARSTGLDSVGESERAGNRVSVNFSRPMSPQNSPPSSPLASSGRAHLPLPNKPPTVSGLPDGEAHRILGSLQQIADRPVKKKKKVVAQKAAEGSHLATDTTGDPSKDTSVKAIPQQQPPSISSTPSPSNNLTQPPSAKEAPRPKKKKKKATSLTGPQSSDASEGFGAAYPSDTDSVTSQLSTTTERPRNYQTRAAGLLAKQPSVVREDRDAEEQAEKRIPMKKNTAKAALNGTVSAGTAANTSEVVSKDRQHARSTSQTDTPDARSRSSLDVPAIGRPQSLSPARAAHFSSLPEYETPGTKHQPPARSVSPAKSALKHSPSRGQSPIEHPNNRRSLALSEASDTTSQMSDDGLRLAPKKKKSVRVSFDEGSVTVGRAASPPTGPSSPVIMSPQNKPKSRSWFDLVREKEKETATSDSDQDSHVTPTPALPSFGSVRGRPDEPVFDSITEQLPSGDWAQETLQSMGSSSDQVVGGLIAQDAAAKDNKVESMAQQASNEPLPPEVTSVEGSGYHSDDQTSLVETPQIKESTATAPEDSQPIFDSSSNHLAAPPELSTKSSLSQGSNHPVPSIALQPASPGLDTGREGQGEWLGMPGGFPDSAEASNHVQPSADPVIEQYLPQITPATIGIAEPEPEAPASQPDPGSHVGAVAKDLQSQIESHSGDESEDTGGSIYSDAAEDPDELDGDGFGSINAIVESPANPAIPTAGILPPASPTKKAPTGKDTPPSPLVRGASDLSEPASDEGWDKAQAYWSGLSQNRKQQLERAAAPGALDEPVNPSQMVGNRDSVPKKKKKVVKKSNPPSDLSSAPLPPWPDRQYQDDIRRSNPPKTTSLESSMRNPEADVLQEVHIRASMRNGPSTKSSLGKVAPRNAVQPLPELRGALQKKSRPVSAVAMVDYNKQPQPASQPSRPRTASAGTTQNSLTPVVAQPKKKTPTPKPRLSRNDSESSSSFKKNRPSTPSSNRYTMKRTMRPSSIDSRPLSPPISGSLNARTSSPTSSTTRRPFSSVGPGALRTSMRDSIDTGKPARTLRGSTDLTGPSRTKSPSRFGFSKGPKAKVADSKRSSRFSSRFGESSDEDSGLPALSSRFADSSDEDEPAGLTPVRGIPRRIDEGDSTDLEDSSVENGVPPSKPKMNGAKGPSDTKPEGIALATGSLRNASGGSPTTSMGTGLQAKKTAEKDKRKRSFFGGLGSKKRDDSFRELNSKSPITDTFKSDDKRVLRPSSPTAGPATPKVDRLQPTSQTSTAQNSPKSPKLQRRHTPQRITSATQLPNQTSWPLLQSSRKTTDTADDRPRTSDGPPANTNERPDIGTRRSTVQSEMLNGASTSLATGRTGKKKKFPMLRKAFGLSD